MAAASSSQPAAAAPYSIDGSGPSRPPIDFSAALSIWRDINLSDLQRQLNGTAPELLEAQKAAVANRKKLADQTREFKKQPDSNKLESFKPLLKAYQTEIDTLTKRSKAAENAFLNVHSALTAAPDPYPFLEVTLEQAASLNDLESLREENAKLKRDLQHHTAEADANKAREAENAHLQERMRSLEQDFEAKLQQRTSALELELSAKWDERIRNLKEREADLTKSLNLAQEQLKHLKSRDETATAKLLEKGHDDEDRDAKGNFAEVELLSRDLERAHARVESVERRNEQLRAEIESVKSGRQESDKLQKLEAETQEKDRKLVQVQSLLETQRQQSADLTKQRSDYADIKRELEIVKAVHFNAEDDEDTELTASTTANRDGQQGSGKKSADGKSLEALLLEKNKRLEDQLATLRRLETDLASIGRDGGRPSVAAKGPAAMSAEDASKRWNRSKPKSPSNQGAKARNAPSSKEGVNGTHPARSVPASASPRPSTSAALGGDSSILPIVTSQRDRFRSRNAELEEELRKQFETISELRTEIKTLQADNLGLYEKVRYLQSYGPAGGRRSGAGAGGDSVIQIGVGATGRTDASGAYPPPRMGDDKYRAKYEESMNPFEAFRGREQSRAMAQLNPLERASISSPGLCSAIATCSVPQ
ncbi:related to Cutl1 or CASP protein [Ustilago trichophora]|uniref:Protein CASP n=1 Tax=Ustilago trichophora TaxID=86804 RepID=A0A5C3E7C1_9BASI|nr:related to Cutl1 or CASP protein [Ustilago trichophora]